MTKQSIRPGGRTGSYDWHANRPMHVAPTVTSIKIIEGVKYYFCGKRQFIAEIYDKNFSAPRGSVIPKQKRVKLKPGR